MKINIKTVGAIMLLSIISFSCNDFLDEKPEGIMTEQGFANQPQEGVLYTNAEQAEQALSGAYSVFKNEFWQLDQFILNDAQSDDAYAGEPNPFRRQIDELRTAINNQNVVRTWGYLYTHIGAANSIITWVPKVPDEGGLSEARKKEIVAEATFMRALCYFYLVRIYGNVPLLMVDIPEINMENLEEIYPLLFPAQSSPEQVFKGIIDDLELVVKDAPDYSADKFKVTKALANFLLAEVYATKDGHENTDWSKVKEYASRVVNDTRFGLMDNYEDLFAVENQDETGLSYSSVTHRNTKESLFEVGFVEGDWNVTNWCVWMFLGFDWKKFNTPSKDLAQAFDTNNDFVRKKASILFKDATGAWGDPYWDLKTYPFAYKQRSAFGNMILYRYADAVLLLAESENELGNIGAAKGLLDRIRNRAGLSNTNASTKDALRLAIETEHRLEFAFEGKRWFDLKRRGRAKEVMKNCSDHQKDAGARLDENHLIWPIPSTEMQLNKFLKQNPGY